MASPQKLPDPHHPAHGEILLPSRPRNGQAAPVAPGSAAAAKHAESLQKTARYRAQIANSALAADADRYARGPRNRKPGLLRLTALLHLITRVSLLATLLGFPVLMILHEPLVKPFLIMPVVFALSGLLWLVCSSRVGCRVCALRMFRNKNCAKSPKAPSWPLLGPHNTLAVHALCCRSVRCPYCGTPNDLSRKSDQD